MNKINKAHIFAVIVGILMLVLGVLMLTAPMFINETGPERITCWEWLSLMIDGLTKSEGDIGSSAGNLIIAMVFTILICLIFILCAIAGIYKATLSVIGLVKRKPFVVNVSETKTKVYDDGAFWLVLPLVFVFSFVSFHCFCPWAFGSLLHTDFWETFVAINTEGYSSPIHSLYAPAAIIVLASVFSILLWLEIRKAKQSGSDEVEFRKVRRKSKGNASDSAQ